MKDRIQKIIEVQQLSSSKFADLIGVQRSNVSHVLSGRNKPSLDFITKILDKFPDIDIEWIMLGKGKMFKTKSPTTLFETEITDIQEDKKIPLKNDSPPVVEPIKINPEKKEEEVIPKKEDPQPQFKMKLSDPEQIIVFFPDKTFTSYRPS